MTTNFIERLVRNLRCMCQDSERTVNGSNDGSIGLQDPALIRPGRVDMVQLIDHASESQISKLFRGARTFSQTRQLHF